MRGTALGSLALGLLLAGPVEARTWAVPGGSSLQQAIAEARPGDRLLVPPGRYQGALAVTVPDLELMGLPGAVLDGQGQGTVVLVVAPRVRLQGFTVTGSGRSESGDDAGIKVLGVRGCRLENNRLVDVHHGIYLQGASASLVLGNRMDGSYPGTAIAGGGDGVHAWNAPGCTLRGNELAWFRDGLYLEFAARSRVERNLSRDHRRYGLHFMFMDDGVFHHNRFLRSMAGSVLMYSHRIRVERNDFSQHHGTAGHGVLLKDVSDSILTHNRLADNHVGLFMDGSNRNQVRHNLIGGNGWGLQLYSSSAGNRFEANSFVLNGYDVAVDMARSRNAFVGNYWSGYHGYDLHGQGHGAVPHAPVSAFGMLVMQYPDLYAFGDSPAVSALAFAQRLVPALAPSELRDPRPLLVPPVGPHGPG